MDEIGICNALSGLRTMIIEKEFQFVNNKEMIVQHFIGAVVPPPLQSFSKFIFNGKYDFSKKDFR